MRLLQLGVFSVVALFISAGQASAEYIPYGLQTNVTQSTLDSWGWTEIHRSGTDTTVSTAPIIAAATGQYLMMGVWDNMAQVYTVLGAGETSNVLAITYFDHTSDDYENYNPNWSNGLNFYRTEEEGAWGFTTNDVTQIGPFYDRFLSNGISSRDGNYEGPQLSTGMSLPTSTQAEISSGGVFGVYNGTGTNYRKTETDRYERVFFTTAPLATPLPSSLLLAGIGALGMGTLIRRRQANDRQAD